MVTVCFEDVHRIKIAALEKVVNALLGLDADSCKLNKLIKADLAFYYEIVKCHFLVDSLVNLEPIFHVVILLHQQSIDVIC